MMGSRDIDRDAPALGNRDRHLLAVMVCGMKDRVFLRLLGQFNNLKEIKSRISICEAR
jgi:hypothetical protein